MNLPKKNYFAPMHSAEHILNKTMVDMFNCERSENCHIEKKKSKCDFILNTEPTDYQIIEIEKSVNHIISQNLPVTHKLMDFDQAEKQFKLRVTKENNPKIRITSIGSFDHCPCIGEHVENTSDIGTFKITTTSFENNIFRIRYKIVK